MNKGFMCVAIYSAVFKDDVDTIIMGLCISLSISEWEAKQLIEQYNFEKRLGRVDY